MSELEAKRSYRSTLNEVLVTVLAFILAFVIGAILMIVSDPTVSSKFGYFLARPGDALGASWTKVSSAYVALVQGAVGSIGAVTETTAQAAPLICAGLGVAVGFRSGLFNIGAQGQAIWGATFAAWIGFGLQMPMIIHIPLAMVGGMAAGALWGGLAGWLRARFGAHEVITTIMLNYVASGLLSWLLITKAFLRPGRTDPVAPVVHASATLPQVPGTRLHLGFLIALLAAVAVWWLMDHTKLGLQIRSVGFNSSAASTAGMNVSRVLVLAMVVSGILTGLAGVQAAIAPDIHGTPTPLTQGLIGSLGFDAITVALLGRSRPVGTVLAGLLFGALHAGSISMQALAGTPYELANVLQALIVMFVAAPMLIRTIAPFLKERRAKSTPSQPAAPTAEEGVTA